MQWDFLHAPVYSSQLPHRRYHMSMNRCAHHGVLLQKNTDYRSVQVGYFLAHNCGLYRHSHIGNVYRGVGQSVKSYKARSLTYRSQEASGAFRCRSLTNFITCRETLTNSGAARSIFPSTTHLSRSSGTDPVMSSTSFLE